MKVAFQDGDDDDDDDDVDNDDDEVMMVNLFLSFLCMNKHKQEDRTGAGL